MRVHRIAGPALLVALAAGPLGGCAGQDGTGAEPAAPATSTPAQPAPTDPVALIGYWTISGAGIPADKKPVLRLDVDSVLLVEGCGYMRGSWRADPAGLLVVDLNGWGGCATGRVPAPDWVTPVLGFRVEGDRRVLTGAGGRTVVTLTPGGRPPARDDLDESQLVPPQVTDKTREAFTPAAPLPAGLTAATGDSLLGRWVPAEGPTGGAKPPFVEFAADGQWHGSDGCNGQGGRWVSGPAGALLATAGPSTLIACDNVPIGGWVDQARRAGHDGDRLVLLDAQGKEIARLRR